MQPTVVNNVETIANIPWIVANGGAAFKAIGVPTSTGMRMFAVSGHVNRPGVYEVPNGTTTFRDLFEKAEYCGGILGGRAVKAFIPGGASAPWFYPEHLDLPLDKPTVDKAGSMLGSGAIVVMDETTDVVKATWRVVRFFARESCGKCTPCREGTNWLEKILKRIIDGHGRPERPRPPHGSVRQHQPRHRVAAAADHDLPARTLGGIADRVGDRPLPRRVRVLHRPRHGEGSGGVAWLTRTAICRSPSTAGRCRRSRASS